MISRIYRWQSTYQPIRIQCKFSSFICSNGAAFICIKTWTISRKPKISRTPQNLQKIKQYQLLKRNVWGARKTRGAHIYIHIHRAFDWGTTRILMGFWGYPSGNYHISPPSQILLSSCFSCSHLVGYVIVPWRVGFLWNLGPTVFWKSQEPGLAAELQKSAAVCLWNENRRFFQHHVEACQELTPVFRSNLVMWKQLYSGLRSF